MAATGDAPDADAPIVDSSELRYRGPMLSVRTDVLRFPDGRTFACDVVAHPGSVAIIATLADERLLLVRQYRYPVHRELWEIPAGKCELGETPLAGGLRELAEETGYHAERATILTTLAVTPGYCDEVLHFVRAHELTAGAQSLDRDECIAVRAVTLEEGMAMFARGEIADVKTLLALLWLRGQV